MSFEKLLRFKVNYSATRKKKGEIKLKLNGDVNGFQQIMKQMNNKSG